MEKNRLFIIVPCYNEQEPLPTTSQMFLSVLKRMIGLGLVSDQSRILFVNDGSKDGTWDIICSLSKQDSHFCGISQSRNRGHQNALYAALMEVKDKCDMAISIDCDAQDDVNVMEDMVRAFQNGFDIVYGVRSKRDTDTFFKRTSARAFYKLFSLMGAKIIEDHADCRLLSSRVIGQLANYRERSLFLRGLIPLIGYSSTTVYYERKERNSGKSHYSLKRMMGLALDGIVSFSPAPLRVISFVGLLVIASGLFVLVYLIIKDPSWVNVLLSVLVIIAGSQLLFLGLAGEYIWNISKEVKSRPRYIISEKVENGERIKL